MLKRGGSFVLDEWGSHTCNDCETAKPGRTSEALTKSAPFAHRPDIYLGTSVGR
jgi:hypothetical protein